MSEKITRRAVEVVLEMLPAPDRAGVDRNSVAYGDIVRAKMGPAWIDQGDLDLEVQVVLSALGRGKFSVLDLDKGVDVPDGMERVSDGFGGTMFHPVKR